MIERTQIWSVRIIVSLTLIILHSGLHAQDWAPVGTTWHYQFTEGFDPCPYPFTNKYFRYSATKDTVVNSQNCRIIQCHIIGDSWNNGTIDTLYGGQEIMYGDSQYVYVYRNNEFYRVFDFTANIGDTITVIDTTFDGFFYYTGQYNLFEYVIDSISDTIVNNDTLKRFYVSPTDSSDWVIDTFHFIIAGVGLDGVIFEGFLGRPLNIGFAGTINGPMRCFDNTVSSYNFLGIPCDTICLDPNPIGVDRNNIAYGSFDFYPNPVSNKLILENKRQFSYIYSIYDYLGHRLISGKETRNIVAIDFSTLANGIYFMKIELENKNAFFTERIIKTD